MKDRKDFISTCQYGWHKGFYNEDDFSKALCSIDYTDFFEYPDDDEFPGDQKKKTGWKAGLRCGW